MSSGLTGSTGHQVVNNIHSQPSGWKTQYIPSAEETSMCV